MLWILLCSIIFAVFASPFDPHVPPKNSADTFFEGWFLRVIDHKLNISFAFIMGSLQYAHQDTFGQNWVAFIYDNNNKVETIQSFPNPNGVLITVGESNSKVVSDPDLKSPSNFRYELPDVGYLNIKDSNADFNILLSGKYRIEGKLTDRVPWSKSSPNGDGPEGYLANLQSLLPCHYFVHSLASKIEYTITEFTDSDHYPQIISTGYAHLETNYGVQFPSAWVWGEGVNETGDRQYVFTGGKFTIAGITSDTYAIAYRSPSYDLTFKTPDLDSFILEKDACNGVMKLTATNLRRSYRLVLNISAPLNTFSEPLYFPTTTGFSNKPGCIESYSAVGVIEVYELSFSFSPLGLIETLKETTSFSLSALEFGGEFMCTKS